MLYTIHIILYGIYVMICYTVLCNTYRVIGIIIYIYPTIHISYTLYYT